ncbi:hypothetical protein [Kitasatospora sp. NPDC090091]|uniref:hypothetical protein n=1 Tax=Kitasatospora sp. NPDC090091 TaxID=3364081 RepID=UPI0038223B1F
MTATPPPASLAERIDAAIRPSMLIGLQDAELYDEPGRERIGEWADSITAWVLAVVQPELDRIPILEDRVSRLTTVLDSADDVPARIARQALVEEDRLTAELAARDAENVRLRAAWQSARHRANHNHLAGRRFPGGAVREALVHAGYITRRDTVTDAVRKINDAPRTWYVRWLVHNLRRLGSAHTHTIAQAKRQTRRAEAAEAENARLRTELADARATGMRDAAAMLRRHCPKHDALSGRASTAFMTCHCPGADAIDHDADNLAARTPTS